MTYVALHVVALLLYVASGVFYGANLALRSPGHVFRGHALLIAALAAHTAGIGAYCTSTHLSPFATGFGTLSIAAWAIGLIYLPIEMATRMTTLGALGVPLHCLLLVRAVV